MTEQNQSISQLKDAAAAACLALDSRAVEFHAVTQELARIHRCAAMLQGSPAWLAACSRHGGPGEALSAAQRELREAEVILAEMVMVKAGLPERIKRLEHHMPGVPFSSIMADRNGSYGKDGLAAKIMRCVEG